MLFALVLGDGLKEEPFIGWREFYYYGIRKSERVVSLRTSHLYSLWSVQKLYAREMKLYSVCELDEKHPMKYITLLKLQRPHEYPKDLERESCLG